MGALVARIMFVRRSSAIPLATFAMRSAVAGATTMASALLARETWGTWCTLFQISTGTGRPDRASHVATPTKLRLALVGTTVTR